MISDWWEDNRNRLQIEYSIYDIHIRRINIKEVIYADMGGQIHAFSAFTYTIYKKHMRMIQFFKNNLEVSKVELLPFRPTLL